MFTSSDVYKLSIFTAIILVLSFSNIEANNYDIIQILNRVPGNDSNGVYAIISCGYSDFIERDMSGTVVYGGNITGPGTDSVFIVEVDAYTSTCFIKNMNKEQIKPETKIEVIVPTRLPEEIYLDAEQAFTDENFFKALIFYNIYLSDSTAENRKEVSKRIKKCNKNIEKVRKSKNIDNKKNEDTTLYDNLGLYFIRHNNKDAARYFYNKLLQIDKNNRYYREVLTAIDLDTLPYDEQADINTFTPVEFYPEMIYRADVELPPGFHIKQVSLVWVGALVNRYGQVVDARVKKTSGNKELDYYAVTSAYKNKFAPGYMNGRPVNCWVFYKVEITPN